MGAVEIWEDWGRVKGLVNKWGQKRCGNFGEEKGELFLMCTSFFFTLITALLKFVEERSSFLKLF